MAVVIVLGLAGVQSRDAGLSWAGSGGYQASQAVPHLNPGTDWSGQAEVYFTRNEGQWDSAVLFRASTANADVWLCRDAIVWQFSGPGKGNAAGSAAISPAGDRFDRVVVRSEFTGSNTTVSVTGTSQVDYVCHYFLGNDPSRWRTDVPNFETVTYRDIYPGIDLQLSGNGGQLQSRWTARSGADLSRVGIRYVSGAEVVEYASGEALVETPWGGEARIALDPRCSKRPIIHGSSMAAGVMEASSTSLALAYSTFLGGTSSDEGRGLAVDEAGNAYITGVTNSSNFPTQDPYDITWNGNSDAFITKLAPSGNSLVFSTFFGGSADDEGRDIAVDASGDVYVAGATASSDLPTQNPFDASFGGVTDYFVLKLGAAGNTLLYSTYLGGGSHEQSAGTTLSPRIAVDGSGNAYIAGRTESVDFPTQSAYDAALSGPSDAVVVKLSPDGSTLVYSTYLGGTSSDEGHDIVVDGSGNAFVSGVTQSLDFPTASAYDAGFNGGVDAFITKISPTGDALSFSTFLGGATDEAFVSIAIDGAGSVYVAGHTQSLNFPTVNAYDAGYNGNYDMFVTKLTPAGDALEYSTYVGGTNTDFYGVLGVDSSGSAYVAARTFSSDFPTLNPYDASQNGNADVIVFRLAPAGNALAYSTYFGGTNNEEPWSIAVDASGSAYVTGNTQSSDFPIKNPFDATSDGSGEPFVFRILPSSPFTVTSLGDSGPGTLRDIITIANGNSARDSVIFGVAGVINLQSPLPACSDAGGGIVIDGFSAPGMVTLDGTGAGSGPGLEFGSEGGVGNIVRGLTIRNFPTAGIALPQIATRTTVSECLFHGNAGPPIDLWGDGNVLANDPGDADAGPNTLLNFPVIDSVFLVGSDTFYVAGTAPANSTVELYLAELYLGADTIGHANNHGEAWRHLGTEPADPSGHFAFAEIPVRAWSYVTATATDASGNTSEFALNRQLIPDSLTFTAYSPVVLTIITPSMQDSIGRDIIVGGFNTIGPTATYDSLTDYSNPPDGDPDDRVIITNIEPGEYQVRVTTKPGDPGTGYVLGIRVDGTNEVYAALNGGTSSEPVTIPVPDIGESHTFSFEPVAAVRGDLDGNGTPDAVDLAILIDVVFFGLSEPDPPGLSDINCDGVTDAVDLALFIDYVFFGGASPCN